MLPADEHGPPAERGLPGGERGLLLLLELLHPPAHLLKQPADGTGRHPLKKLIDTDSSLGDRRADVYLNSEVSLPEKNSQQSFLSSQVQLQVL